MSTTGQVRINKLPIGVPGLDEIPGGGLPVLYFTILGEPAIKMLRYHQQYAFFDQAKFNNAVRFINLSHVVLEKDLDANSKDIREYEITSKDMVIIGDRLTDYEGLITGAPNRLNRSGNNEERSQKPNNKKKS